MKLRLPETYNVPNKESTQKILESIHILAEHGFGDYGEFYHACLFYYKYQVLEFINNDIMALNEEEVAFEIKLLQDVAAEIQRKYGISTL